MRKSNKNLKKTIIVAEVGNNHEGNFKIAKKLIKEARNSGADIVKFQMFNPKFTISEKDFQRIKILKKFLFTKNQFKALSNYSRSIGIKFFCTPFDIEGARFLNKIQNIFKISSGDNNFYPLINEIAHFNKTIILSTGMSTIPEIKKVKNFIFKAWGKNIKKCDLILLHCVSDYPVKANEANLKAILNLKKNFPDCIIGYSDHTVGIEAAIGAAALGATIIEKHFTLSKNFSNFRDHKISADPKDMTNMVAQIRNIDLMMGSGIKKPSLGEKKNIKIFRRSIVASRNIKKGDKIKYTDFNWIRNSHGLSPGFENKFLNKKIKTNLLKGRPFKLKSF